ncbi:MAG: hypothetical protein HQL23_09420, partial [Candidatus Omnitrophica bacterium]|nr:hypothetical protein [Candidatus Omnitrophota bacterium]
MITFLSVIATISVITNLGIAAFLLFRGKRHSYNLLFGFVALSLAIWSFALKIFSSLGVADRASALLWWQIGYIGVIFAPMFFAQFVFKYVAIRNKILSIAIYLLGVSFVLLNFYDHSRLFLCDVRFLTGQYYWHDWTANKNIVWLSAY